MLIVAIPKSASSSLAMTLAEAVGVPQCHREGRAQIRYGAPVPAAYRALQAFHSEFIDLDEARRDIVVAAQGVTKHHFPPTETNQRLLADVPKVILLRPEDDVIDAYWRGYATGTWITKNDAILQARDLESWRAIARRIGLYDELRAFNDGWQAHEGDKLLLSYRDLIDGPADEIARIAKYFGRSAQPVTGLSREKFSGEVAPVAAKLAKALRQARFRARQTISALFSRNS